MVLVGDNADAADNWIIERIEAADVCVTSDIMRIPGEVARESAMMSPTIPI
jgi:uncharacterized protein YaiI (UPF0178 family)